LLFYLENSLFKEIAIISDMVAVFKQEMKICQRS